ncbi:MAG: acyl-CoA synthetase, partial [Candidatus Methylomirabilis sp.]|nr:acyl-CoA synthetase [Deltaproteobacteria bacterium]
HEACNQVAHGLRALGVKTGDAIAVMTPNCAAVPQIYLAAAQVGLYYVPINSHLVGPEVAYILRDSGAKAFFTHEKVAEAAKAAIRESGIDPKGCFAVGKVDGCRDFESVKAGRPAAPPSDRTAGTAMNYTSGTTGRPKGVRRPLPPIDADTMAANFASFLMLFGIMPRDNHVHLVVSPLYHTAVLNFCMNSLHMGHTTVLMDKWTPEGMLDKVQRYKVTHTHMVPTQFNRLLQLPEETRKKYDVSSFRQVIHGAAPCSIETKRKMLDWWGPVVTEYYSASEGGGTTCTAEQWLRKPGSVGTPWPISQIKIVDDDGKECAPKTVGTVYIKMGDHRFEYHGDKGKTHKAWREDGFFTVGDAGYLDEDGYLFLVDRKSDMIISGGQNIYPAEIEAVLQNHPKVGDVAVFGIPDEDWGEQVKAVVEPIEGEKASPALAEEILAYAKENLASYKRPKSVDFVDALPRDPNGKLFKRKLRDPYWAGRDKAI